MIGQSEKFDAIHHPSVIITNFGAKFMDKCKMSSPISDHKITTDSHTIFNVFKFLALTKSSKSSYLCLLPESSSNMSRAPSPHQFYMILKHLTFKGTSLSGRRGQHEFVLF